MEDRVIGFGVVQVKDGGGGGMSVLHLVCEVSEELVAGG